MKLLLRDTCNRMRVVADSAIGRDGQPWFIPDFGSAWRWRKAVAFRVSKLGKNVSAKFAPRYFDAVTLLWVAEADNCDALDYMDGAVVCGQWRPVGEIPADIIADIVEVTAYATVKNGDIFALMLPDAAEPMVANRRVELALNNEIVLRFNIK